MAKPALKCGDLKHIKSRAAAFQREHPGLDPAKLKWGERLCSQEARDAFTMATLTGDAINAVREVGSRPCLRCGLFTSSWCEGCELPSPSALCTVCDKAHLLCFSCSNAGKVWTEVHKAPQPNVMEISGFHDDNMVFHTLEPPLQLPTESIPVVDGVYDMGYISQVVAEHHERLRQASGPSSGSG